MKIAEILSEDYSAHEINRSRQDWNFVWNTAQEIKQNITQSDSSMKEALSCIERLKHDNETIHAHASKEYFDDFNDCVNVITKASKVSPTQSNNQSVSNADDDMARRYIKAIRVPLDAARMGGKHFPDEAKELLRDYLRDEVLPFFRRKPALSPNIQNDLMSGIQELMDYIEQQIPYNNNSYNNNSYNDYNQSNDDQQPKSGWETGRLPNGRDEAQQWWDNREMNKIIDRYELARFKVNRRIGGGYVLRWSTDPSINIQDVLNLIYRAAEVDHYPPFYGLDMSDVEDYVNLHNQGIRTRSKYP